jgi:hypothetical protein
MRRTKEPLATRTRRAQQSHAGGSSSVARKRTSAGEHLDDVLAAVQASRYYEELLPEVRTTAAFRAILYINANILPRQARDEHRESTQKKDDRFLSGAEEGGGAPAGCPGAPPQPPSQNK